MKTDNGLSKIQGDFCSKEGRNHNLWYSTNGKFIVYPDGITLSSESVEYYLKERGYRFDKGKTKGLIPDGQAKKQEIIRDFSFHKVIESSPLWDAGLHEYNAKRYLVLRTPKRIEPIQGKWPTIDLLLKGNLTTDRDYWEAWLYLATLGYYYPDKFCPGQLLVMMGTGHDFFQEHLINASLGTKTDPFGFYLEMGARPLELSANYSWAVNSRDLNELGKRKRSRFATLMQFCANARGDALGYELPIHSRGSVSMDVNPDTEWLLSDYVFESHSDLLVVKIEEKEKPEGSLVVSELPAYLWHLLHEYRIPGKILGNFQQGYFSPGLREASFSKSPEARALSWLAKLYSVEKAAGEMTILEAFIVDRWELAGISKGMITALLKERPLNVLLHRLGLRYPRHIRLSPGDNQRWGFYDLGKLTTVEN